MSFFTRTQTGALITRLNNDVVGAQRALTGTLGWVTSAPQSLWIGLLVIRGFAGFCNAPLHPGAAADEACRSIAHL